MVEHSLRDPSLTALTNTESSLLYTASILSSSLSACGSACIIYLCTRQVNRSHLYHRILLALSVSDVGLSVNTVLQVLLSPQIDFVANAKLSIGNWRTCNVISSIWSLFAFSGPIYNCMLALFFYLTICRNVPDKKLAVWLERPVHLIAFSVCVGFAISAFVHDAVTYHFLALACVPGGSLFFNFAPGAVVGLSALISVLATTATYITVRKQMRRSRRFSFHSSMTSNSQQTSREAGIQSVLYCVAFLNSILWIGATTAIGLSVPKDDQLSGFFSFKLCMTFFFPLQGFFNFGVYIRPQVARWKRVEPNRTWVWAFRKAMGHDIPLRSNQRRNSKSGVLLAVLEKEEVSKKSSSTGSSHRTGDDPCQNEGTVERKGSPGGHSDKINKGLNSAALSLYSGELLLDDATCCDDGQDIEENKSIDFEANEDRKSDPPHEVADQLPRPSVSFREI